ncbi:putative transcription factor C3H family [Helianthus annuus]|uniref:Putative U2 auxiliary factor small subunit, Nucleotide-binding alpha-beta plait domain protein n=1 Tax=Helianthus annuus TaxID=4232 RepID=A0A251U6R9_HELAN|nr:zinc finger CCCH domain-containing protein 25 [Helianthus annuus]KAF5795953.1 putative transcription factor C3H family [Helianthus annuus]KAJ0539388.1 putative transcription factor C3H family [Helianthus annuus]KAJ0765300.1 putative transcription factor C3H family [Helianthus annuus]
MNPLTLVKRIQNINSKEASLGISEEASWHAKYKDSAYVYVGGIPFDLTEGDLLAVFAQYGEIVDVNLVRDKGTGKSKGFAFVAYEDQRSTILAVDNLNGAQVLGRTIRVDHVTKYKKKEEEDEEAEQQKREARGVCRAFQRGECTRGAGCRFSHNEQRAANTGWGAEDAKNSRWENDKYVGPTRGPGSGPSHRGMRDKDGCDRQKETSSRDEDTRSSRMKPDKKDEDYFGKRSSRYDSADDDRRNEKRSKYDSESYRRERQESDRRTSRDHRRKDEDHRVRSHRE